MADDAWRTSLIAEMRERETHCPRCGRMFWSNARGRPKVWCSQECRRAAYEERRAADNGAIGIRVIEKAIEPTLDVCVERVLGSPTACARVLDGLKALDNDEPLSPYGRWSRTWRSAQAFASAWRARRS